MPLLFVALLTMVTGIAASVANAILDALCRSVAWSEPAAFWVKLHTGDPGAAGTANAATETDRIQATFSAASGGAITNSAALLWASVAAAETYSHVSFWDASTGGTFIGSDALNTARTVAIGDDFEIAAGEFDLSLGAVAA